MCEIVGYSSGELLSRRFQDVTHPDDVDADVANLQAVLDGRTASYQMEKRYVRADGTDVWTLLAVSLVRDGAGQPLHFVAQIQDISQRRHLEAELRRLADRDDLTGLYNRRFFTRQLAHQLRRTRRYGEDAAVLLVDLDGFKRVNDTLGHHAGDELLRHVARVLNTRLRESDIVARLGGDEFAVLLPLATAERAHQAAELLERELRKSPIEVEGAVLTAGASIGVAELTPDLEAEDALRLADRAMYAVKRGRRAAAASRPDAS
jgi:diguanylate cyclase (GGDEF)-like protein/PAS domain S-box-containing protein